MAHLRPLLSIDDRGTKLSESYQQISANEMAKRVFAILRARDSLCGREELVHMCIMGEAKFPCWREIA